jgi:hypothetical protein
MQRVKFVMKGGAVIKDDLAAQNDETLRNAAK